MSVELTPAMFHILLVLAEENLHGYGIMQEVEAATGGEVRLPPGTLYRSIKRMLEDGLIEVSGSPLADDEDDERRRYYRITEPGRRLARAEARRLNGIVGLARSKKLLEDTDPV